MSYGKSQPSADHLLRLIQLNVINSLTRNSDILGLTVDWLVCSSLSPFGLPPSLSPSCSPSTSSPNITLAPYPKNMHPTVLQLSVPHHPLVDLFPLPQMRDNCLVAISQILTHAEEEDLWNDMIESGGGKDWTGMIVWGEPWDPRSWEVTWPFLERWGWLLQGCDEIIESTNKWRRERGERPVDLEVCWPRSQASKFMEVRHEVCGCQYHRTMAELSRKVLETRLDI